MPNTVVFRADVNAAAYDKSSFWREPSRVREYFLKYGIVKLLYHNDDLRGSTHRCIAVIRFGDCNVANQVKQRYNGRPLFGTRVTTTWLNMEQMKKLGMIPSEEEPDVHTTREGSSEQLYRTPRDYRHTPARHPGGGGGYLSPPEDGSPCGKGPNFGNLSSAAEASSPTTQPASWDDWNDGGVGGVGGDVPEGAHFSLPHFSSQPGGRSSRGFPRGGGGRGSRGTRGGRSRGRGGGRGGGRCPPNLPRKRELGDKVQERTDESPAKSRSKKRLFEPSYTSPTQSKRPRKSSFSNTPSKELPASSSSSPDSLRTIFDRLGPTAAPPPHPPAMATREGSGTFVGDARTGDKAFAEPHSDLRTPSPEKVGGGFAAKRGRGLVSKDLAARTGRGDSASSTKLDRSLGYSAADNWSPVQSNDEDRSPIQSNWSPHRVVKAEYSPKDGSTPSMAGYLNRSPDHPTKLCAEQAADVPSRSPDHQSRVEDRFDISNRKVVQSPDCLGTRNWSPDHPAGLERLTKYAEVATEGTREKGRSQGEHPQEINVDQNIGSRGDAWLGVRAPSPGNSGGVATSGSGTRPGRTGGDQHCALKASIVKEFDIQASLLAKSCKLLLSDNAEQSLVIVASLKNTLTKLAEKLAHKYKQHPTTQ